MSEVEPHLDFLDGHHVKFRADGTRVRTFSLCDGRIYHVGSPSCASLHAQVEELSDAACPARTSYLMDSGDCNVGKKERRTDPSREVRLLAVTNETYRL